MRTVRPRRPCSWLPSLLSCRAARRADADELPAAENGSRSAPSPIDSFDARAPERKQFGVLEFRGGLELSSSHRAIRRTVGLARPAGRRLSSRSTDKAHWLRGRIVYRGGKPSAIVNAEIAPMLGPDGRTITARGWYDSEALADDGSGIGLCRVRARAPHCAVRHGKEGLLARGQPIRGARRSFAKLPEQRAGSNALIVPQPRPQRRSPAADRDFRTRATTTDGNIRGFIMGGQRAGAFSVKLSDEFDIVDCALTPNAELLILERRFSWRRGVAMRIRRVALSSSVVPGALLDGTILIEADMGFQIDNMEGIERAPRRQWRVRAHARLRRQFFGDPAHIAAAIHADRQIEMAGTSPAMTKSAGNFSSPAPASCARRA